MYRTEANIINWHVPWKLHFIPVGKYSSYVGSIYDNRQNQKIDIWNGNVSRHFHYRLIVKSTLRFLLSGVLLK